MNDKAEKQIPIELSKTVQTESLAEKTSSSSVVKDCAWKGINLITVSAITSMCIVAVQSPIKTILANLTMNGTMIPPYTRSIMGFAKALYAGTMTSLGGSLARTAYVTTAKNGARPIEETIVTDEAGSKNGGRKITLVDFGYVASMSLGEILVTNIFESRATLQKLPGLLPANFRYKTPHNAYKLMTGGIAPRYLAGIINFGSLCMLEEKIEKKISFSDKRISHFTAGALSGMTAAFFSFPLALFKDYVLVQSTVKDGLLYNKSSLKVAKEIYVSFKANPRASLKAFARISAKQLLMRVGLTGTVFGIVAGVGETLGNEPWQKIIDVASQPSRRNSDHRFFTAESDSAITERWEEPVNGLTR